MRYRLTQPALPAREALWEPVLAALSGRRLTQGAQVEALEEAVAARCEVACCVAVSSCTLALSMLTRALGLGGEVVTPSFTFLATAQALAWGGAGLALAESEASGFTLDVASAEAALGPEVEGICAVNVFGLPPAMGALEALASRRGLALIVDSAQGLGARCEGRAVGSCGDAEVFSLSPSKVVTALEGGLITTQDASLARRLRGMRDYGRYAGDAAGPVGVNGRMSELHAAVGLASLARLEGEVAQRRALLGRYREVLSGEGRVRLQAAPEERTSNGTFAGVVLPEGSRDAVAASLAREGIETRAYFSPPLHAQVARQGWRWRAAGSLDGAAALGRRMLCLPLHSGLTLEDCDEIARCLTAALDQGGAGCEREA